MRHKLAAAVVGLMLACLHLSPASAEMPDQASSLCSGDLPRGCAIEASGWMREGATFPVTVFGAPQTRVQVVAYQAIADGEELLDLRQIGDGIEMIVGSQGVSNVNLVIPAVVEEPSSGWALISVGGITGTDVSMTVGTFVPFGARIPTVLGDGYAESKPVGTTLQLHHIGAIPGTRFGVEYLDDSETWRDITIGTSEVTQRPEEISTIEYMLPRGLTDTPKQLRLTNQSDTAVSPVWLAVPSVDGEAVPRDPVFVPPPVGDALEGVRPLTGHPEKLVKNIAVGLGAGSFVVVAGALAIPRLRRSRSNG